jgi:membrane-bound serine protease (ClpP class)
VLVVIGLIIARIPPDLFSPPSGGGGGYELPTVSWGSVLLMSVVPVVGGLGLGVLGVLVLMRFFPRLPLFNRLVLQGDLSGAVVTAAQGAGAGAPEQLVGRLGTAATNLRPGGSARFDGKLVDVISDGEWLEAGTPLKIVSADSNRIVVRRA